MKLLAILLCIVALSGCYSKGNRHDQEPHHSVGTSIPLPPLPPLPLFRPFEMPQVGGNVQAAASRTALVVWTNKVYSPTWFPAWATVSQKWVWVTNSYRTILERSDNLTNWSQVVDLPCVTSGYWTITLTGKAGFFRAANYIRTTTN